MSQVWIRFCLDLFFFFLVVELQRDRTKVVDSVCYFFLWLFFVDCRLSQTPIMSFLVSLFRSCGVAVSRFMTWWIRSQEESRVAVLGLGFGRSKLWNHVARIFATRNESEDAQFCKKTVDSRGQGGRGWNRLLLRDFQIFCIPFSCSMRSLCFDGACWAANFFVDEMCFLQPVTLLALPGAWCEERDIFKS